MQDEPNPYDTLRRIFERNGFEVWLKREEDLYEAFASKACDDYLGCFDTVEEAKAFAKRWHEDQLMWG